MNRANPTLWALAVVAVVVLVSMGGAIILAGYPVGLNDRSYYTPVAPPYRKIGPGEPGTEYHSLYAIRDGRLYLLEQRWGGGLLGQRVRVGFWVGDALPTFRAAHPELEQYWPDPKRADGGVWWLRTTMD